MEPSDQNNSHSAQANSRIASLRTMIAKRVKAKQLDCLQRLDAEALGILPTAPDLLRLPDQLRLRESSPRNAENIGRTVAEADELRQACRFAEAAELLERIPAAEAADGASSLQSACQSLARARAA